MTTDEIRAAIGEYLWEFWNNNHNISAIKRAKKILKQELEDGIIPRETKYFAEYELLCMRLGENVELDLK